MPKRSNKLQSLPTELRAVADELIAEKFPELESRDYSFISIGTPSGEDSWAKEYMLESVKSRLSLTQEAISSMPYSEYLTMTAIRHNDRRYGKLMGISPA